jgi:hypothetical protein
MALLQAYSASMTSPLFVKTVAAFRKHDDKWSAAAARASSSNDMVLSMTFTSSTLRPSFLWNQVKTAIALEYLQCNDQLCEPEHHFA